MTVPLQKAEDGTLQVLKVHQMLAEPPIRNRRLIPAAILVPQSCRDRIDYYSFFGIAALQKWTPVTFIQSDKRSETYFSEFAFR
jgi:hypothetical protein